LGSPDVTFALGTDDLRQATLPEAGGYERRIQAYSAQLSAKAGPVSLTSLTGLNYFKFSDAYDYAPLGGSDGFYNSLYHVSGSRYVNTNDTKKVTQELRASAALNSRFEVLVGGFFAHETTSLTQEFQATEATTGTPTNVWGTADAPTSYSEYAVYGVLTA